MELGEQLLLELMLGVLAATARMPVQALQAVQGLLQQRQLERGPAAVDPEQV